MTGIDQQIATLDALSSSALRSEWQRVTGGPVPRVSPSLLRLALSWEYQARARGGHSRAMQQRLNQLNAGRSHSSDTRSGMRLVREWQGTSHIVTIGEDRAIHWNGKQWRSLSEVARAITGTRWSGPAFFGLKKRLAA